MALTPKEKQYIISLVSKILKSFKEQNYAECTGYIDSIIRLYPYSSNLYELKGDIYHKEAKYKRALYHYDQALRIDRMLCSKIRSRVPKNYLNFNCVMCAISARDRESALVYLFDMIQTLKPLSYEHYYRYFISEIEKI